MFLQLLKIVPLLGLMLSLQGCAGWLHFARKDMTPLERLVYQIRGETMSEETEPEGPLDERYLRNLSRFRGIRYLREVREAVDDGRADRLDAERFLMAIYENSVMLWMRAAAKGELVRMNPGHLDLEEPDRIVDAAVLREIAYGLGEAGGRETLLAWYDRENDENIQLDILNALHGNTSNYSPLRGAANGLYCDLMPDMSCCDGFRSVRKVRALLKTQQDCEERKAIALMLSEIGSEYAFDTLVQWGKQEKDEKQKQLIVSLTFKLAGYRVFETWKDDLQALETLVSISIDEELRIINKNSDWGTGGGLSAFEDYIKRYNEETEVLFAALVLSNELNKRTYGIIFQELNSSLINKGVTKRRGRSLFSFALAKQHSHLFTSFIVSLASYDKFEMFFKQTRMPIETLLDLIFSENNLVYFNQHPVKFYMVLREMAKIEEPYLKKVFLEKIRSLAASNEIVAVAMEAMVQNRELRAKELGESGGGWELPALTDVWTGPQKSWLTEDNVLRVGIFWSLENKLEQLEFNTFAEIFSGTGRRVSYEGYSEIPVTKMEGELSPDRIFVKEFAETGRKVELHLYSDMEALKTNWYPIVVSRGHANDEEVFYSTAYKDTLRFALHSSSQRKCETLIRENTDTAVVSVIGGEKGRDSDRIFLSFLEYLGRVEQWDDWNVLKRRAFFDLPDNLPVHYRFPDDTSLRFAAYLHKVEQLKRRVEN